jgi:hypothetical protein
MPGVNSRLQARVPGSQHRQHVGDEGMADDVAVA